MTVKTSTAGASALQIKNGNFAGPLNPPSPSTTENLKIESNNSKKVGSRLTFSVDSLLSKVKEATKQIDDDKIEVRPILKILFSFLNHASQLIF